MIASKPGLAQLERGVVPAEGGLDTGRWIRQRKESAERVPGSLIISSRRFEGRAKKEESHGKLRGVREA